MLKISIHKERLRTIKNPNFQLVLPGWVDQTSLAYADTRSSTPNSHAHIVFQISKLSQNPRARKRTRSQKLHPTFKTSFRYTMSYTSPHRDLVRKPSQRRTRSNPGSRSLFEGLHKKLHRNSPPPKPNPFSFPK